MPHTVCVVASLSPPEDPDIEQFPLVIDHQMLIEAKEPTNRGVAPCSPSLKHPMRLNATIVADLAARRVEKADAATLATVLKIGTHWQQGGRYSANEAAVAHPLGERSPQYTQP